MVRFTVVIPLKAPALAKSRLRGAVSDVPQLALAFAADTAAAASASTLVDGVVIVTDDGAVRSATQGLDGVRFVADPGGGLNAAIVAGVATVSGPVVVLPGDLPAVSASDLDAALMLAAATRRCMVPDHTGLGTTFLAAGSADDLAPRFGEGSRSRHEGAGHVVLPVAESSALRWDVDTADDLAIALRLGVGVATARVVAEQFDGRG